MVVCLLVAGCGAGQRAAEAAKARSCETHTQRPFAAHLAPKAHTPDGHTVATVNLERGEALCLEVQQPGSHAGDLTIVDASRGPALGVRLSSAGSVLWVNNQLDQALSYSAMVELANQQGVFATDVTRVAKGSVGEQEWKEEVEAVRIFDFELSP
jgi:hypothetical protein